MGVDKARTAESGCDQRSSGLAHAGLKELQEFSAKGPTRIWRLGGLCFIYVFGNLAMVRILGASGFLRFLPL